MARVAGRAASWLLLGGLAVAAGVQACTDGGDSGTADLPLSELLAQVGPGVVLPALADFQAELEGLELALGAWQSGDATLADAQATWAAAMASWQVLELMQVGPAGSSLEVAAGEDLRDELYSWPSVNGCRIDQETTEEAWDDAGFFDENRVNSYGLDGLEHLLHAELVNSCPSQTGIDEDWDALGEGGVTANRQAYALALVRHAAGVAETLHTAWDPAGDDFSTALTASTDASPYSSESEAFSAVFDALFYLDLVTKDRKLAQPLGLVECADTRCPEDVEHLLSGQGAAAIAANLDGFERLFTGGEGAGFDDLLTELGEQSLADDVLAAVATARASAGAVTDPLDTLVLDDPETLEGLHTDLKAVTDLLKGDLLTVLSLAVPDEASGDND